MGRTGAYAGIALGSVTARSQKPEFRIQNDTEFIEGAGIIDFTVLLNSGSCILNSGGIMMRITAEYVIRFIEGVAAQIKLHREELIALDSAIGDADHGTNMDRGFSAVLEKLPTVADKDIGTILKTLGMTLVSTVGGASG